MAYVQLPRFGLAIDWETSGYTDPASNPLGYAARHQGVSFGAIIYDCSTLEAVEEMYCEIKFDSRYLWDVGAERVHGLTRAHLEQNGLTQEEAAVLLANLIIKYIGTEDVQPLGHRVAFDKAFTDQLLETIGVKLRWHPTSIDSCVLGSALMELSRSEDIFTTLGMPPRNDHNSLEDIRHTLSSVAKMKEYFILGVTVALQQTGESS